MIAVDAMGGDYAPGAVVEGAVKAARKFDIPVVLVGDKRLVEEELGKYEVGGIPVSVRHASQAVEMSELPSHALRRKKDSSIRVAIQMVKSGEADAVFSAGNTGAAMAVATVVLRPLKGIVRPAIAAIFPTPEGWSIVVDVGANVDCKAIHLFQFGIMGAVYAKYMLGKVKPRVGLLSIGEEEGKGNEVILEAFQMLKRSSVQFIGNVEGREVFTGEADVLVCDGFTGNVALKISEGLVDYYETVLKDLFSGISGKIAGGLLQSQIRHLKTKTDYVAIGGAPLLGVNGTCIIGHGSSGSESVMNGIRQAQRFVTYNINTHIQDDVELNQDIQQSAQAKGRFWQSIKESLHRKGIQEDEESEDKKEEDGG